MELYDELTSKESIVILNAYIKNIGRSLMHHTKDSNNVWTVHYIYF